MIKTYLSYNRTERGGALLVILILVIVVAWRSWMPSSIFTGEFNINDYSAELTEFRKEIESIKRESKRPMPEGIKKNREPKSYPEEPPALQYIYDTIVLELNTADTLDLQLLRGIGPWFAGNIVKYRELLGGYYKKEQLLEVFGMDSSRYLSICDNIRVDAHMTKKIDLNHDPFKTYLRHPYFDYHIVKEIFRYRSGKGRIDSVGELRRVDKISELIYDKISPYVKVEDQ